MLCRGGGGSASLRVLRRRGLLTDASRSWFATISEDTDEGVDSALFLPTLQAQLRGPDETGSRGSRRCRASRMYPGVLYGSGPGQSGRGERSLLKVDAKAIDAEIRRRDAAFESTVYDLVVQQNENGEGATAMGGGGEEGAITERVLPTSVRLHPVMRTVLNVNFIRFKPGRCHAIPLRFIDEDMNPNIKRGAIIIRIMSHARIVLPDDPGDVPQYLDLSMEKVRAGSKVKFLWLTLTLTLSMNGCPSVLRF
ncbi:unnamed protein product [Discosporangium mesarthrocarpum]